MLVNGDFTLLVWCYLIENLNFIGSSQRKNVAMLDSSDTDSVSSSSTLRSDQLLVYGVEDLQIDKETSVLDQALDALYEKR